MYTGIKRGVYNPRNSVHGGTKMVTLVGESVSFRGETYFQLSNSNLLSE